MDISSVKSNLEKQYQAILTTGTDWLAFLHAMDSYLNYVESDPILSKIIRGIREKHASETIEAAQSTLVSIYAQAHYNMITQAQAEEEADGTSKKSFPLYRYNEILKAQAQFEKVKHLKTIEEIRHTTIILEEKSFLGTVTSKGKGWGFINVVEYGYSKYISEIHTALLQELENVEAGAKIPKYLEYDTDTSILYFNNKEIPMNIKKLRTNAHYLLSYLFNNKPFEKHAYDDVDLDRPFGDPKRWKSYHDACEDINKKVERETGISDFMDYSSGEGMYMSVNPKYSIYNTKK